jgi:hypothetical protein
MICNNFIIPKQDGTPRQVHNGRPLKAYFERRHFQLPNTMDALVHEFNWAGVLDISSAYMHLGMS